MINQAQGTILQGPAVGSYTYPSREHDSHLDEVPLDTGFRYKRRHNGFKRRLMLQNLNSLLAISSQLEFDEWTPLESPEDVALGRVVIR